MSVERETSAILLALANGATLKAHRYIDGTKCYRLHPLDGPAIEVHRASVETLLSHGFVTSNQKFPAATFMLTAKGRAAAQDAT